MKRLSRSATIQVDAPPEEVFPLFTPLGEKRWSAEWAPEFIYPENGEATIGTVFKTAAHSPGNPESIWVITAYDAENYAISYIVLTPDVQVLRIEVQCSAAAEGYSDASVTYTYTALSERGERNIEKFTAQHYDQEMARWERAINLSLVHGQPLPHH